MLSKNSSFLKGALLLHEGRPPNTVQEGNERENNQNNNLRVKLYTNQKKFRAHLSRDGSTIVGIGSTKRSLGILQSKGLDTINASILSKVEASDNLFKPSPEQILLMRGRVNPLIDTSPCDIASVIIVGQVFAANPAHAPDLPGGLDQGLMLELSEFRKVLGMASGVEQLALGTQFEHGLDVVFRADLVGIAANKLVPARDIAPHARRRGAAGGASGSGTGGGVRHLGRGACGGAVVVEHACVMKRGDQGGLGARKGGGEEEGESNAEAWRRSGHLSTTRNKRQQRR